MLHEKLQNRIDAMSKVKQATEGRPCAVCTEKSQGAYKFKPKKPGDFGINKNQELIIPICARCLQAGPNDDFIEATLKHAGIKRTIDD